jgi:hypothetical protein
VVYAYFGLLFNHRKERSIDAYCTFDKLLSHYGKQKKPDTKGHRLMIPFLRTVQNKQI